MNYPLLILKFLNEISEIPQELLIKNLSNNSDDYFMLREIREAISDLRCFDYVHTDYEKIKITDNGKLRLIRYHSRKC